MRDGGRARVEQSFGKKAFPGRMLKGNDAHAITKRSKDFFVLSALRFLGKGEQMHLVFRGKTLQKMIGAMIGAAIQGPRNVGVDREYLH